VLTLLTGQREREIKREGERERGREREKEGERAESVGGL
jgi:hypothetical protein